MLVVFFNFFNFLVVKLSFFGTFTYSLFYSAAELNTNILESLINIDY